MSDDSRSNVRQRVDQFLDQLIAEFYEAVPFSRHQMEDQNLHLEYYKRHNIETVVRLRMKRVIDGLTIHYFTQHDRTLAKKWCIYTADEMLHDVMFLKDLEKVGVSKEQVDATKPLFATKLLQGYFYYGLEHEGRPMASLSSSYFIEYTTQKTQPIWLDNLEKVLGKEKVKGQRAHVDHDLEDDHIDFVWDVLSTFINSQQDEDDVFQHLANIGKLFTMYFQELYELTVSSTSAAVDNADSAA
ncbi:iron-containing redox enzyme family protein [Thiohalocapsa sp. ML1]|jgi:hypothetical protein|uniref:iron-containing redox enzyme family protein n=1 Tax=Thiohalocapsa sp. ML1 TaxID=1431688 RepID=UPI000732284D|nr:iron-containing redox enzyme family protein [Thiohalocapsa sp. ML1]